jgi:hypothetical protein
VANANNNVVALAECATRHANILKTIDKFNEDEGK